MTIKRTVHRGKEEVTAVGTVDGVYFNELPKPITPQNGGEPLKFAIQLVVDGDRINAGLAPDKSRGLGGKDSDDKWQTVTNGSKVDVLITREEPWERNGKSGVNYYTTPSNIDIIELAAQSAPKGNSGTGNTSGNKGSTGGYQKRDTTGMEAGHAINAALCLLSYKPKDNAEVLAFSKQLHDITVDLKEAYSKQKPDMSDYDVGASVGHAVLNSCRMLTKTKVDAVYDTAKELLAEVAEPTLAYIRGEEPKPEEEESQEVDQEQQAQDDYYDDDIPF